VGNYTLSLTFFCKHPVFKTGLQNYYEIYMSRHGLKCGLRWNAKDTEFMRSWQEQNRVFSRLKTSKIAIKSKDRGTIAALFDLHATTIKTSTGAQGLRIHDGFGLTGGIFVQAKRFRAV
jgi:hypothetical protein